MYLFSDPKDTLFISDENSSSFFEAYDKIDVELCFDYFVQNYHCFIYFIQKIRVSAKIIFPVSIILNSLLKSWNIHKMKVEY